MVSFPPDFLIERRAIIADKINGENTIGVEFSLDGGKSWTGYDTQGATADKWVYWFFNYTPEAPGTSWTRHDTAGTDSVR